jgi:hypothetical protein
MPGGKGKINGNIEGKQFEKGNKAAEKWTEDLALEFGNDLLNWLKLNDENIFFEEFILLVVDRNKYVAKISRDTPSYLAKKYSSFLELLEEAKDIEKLKLQKFGVFDKLNPSIVKFLLSAKFGMSEKIQTENTHSIIEQPLFPENE